MNSVCGVTEPGLAENLATLNFVTTNTAEQRTDVVASFALVEQLAEHFDARDGGLGGVA